MCCLRSFQGALASESSTKLGRQKRDDRETRQRSDQSHLRANGFRLDVGAGLFLHCSVRHPSLTFRRILKRSVQPENDRDAEVQPPWSTWEVKPLLSSLCLVLSHFSGQMVANIQLFHLVSACCMCQPFFSPSTSNF